jgi:hypothetical protein
VTLAQITPTRATADPTESHGHSAGAAIDESFEAASDALNSVVEKVRGRNSGTTAVGQTAGGKATDQYGNPLEPSGKPQVDRIKTSSKKEAKDIARGLGDGAPVKHPSPTVGEPNFHPTGPGEKIPNSPHVEYPQ